jgi:hypothetical protein
METGQRYLYFVLQITLLFSSVVDKREKLHKLPIGPMWTNRDARVYHTLLLRGTCVFNTQRTPKIHSLKTHCFSVTKTNNWFMGSSVGIATDYGLDGPGIESRWKRDFLPVQTSPGAHTAFCTMGTGSSPGVKSGRGVLLTTHRLLALRSWKSRAIPLPLSGPQPGL